MDIWRVQLKPNPSDGISYKDVLSFCIRNRIIGVGWPLIKGRTNDFYELKREIGDIDEYSDNKTGALKAVNAIRQMQTGDLVWTRFGGDASDYYLCKVGEILWKDRLVTDEHMRHDIGNFVSADWVCIGKEDKVPGKVVNSFCARGTAQRVYNVQEISMYIWNKLCSNSKKAYTVDKLAKESFWTMIGSEELECLILLYLQYRGYMIYSSTLKRSTAKYETVMVARNGSHLCFPQVKRNTHLDISDYIEGLDDGDRVYLFTTSEDYIGAKHPQIECFTKHEIENFMYHHYEILPKTVQYWLDAISK